MRRNSPLAPGRRKVHPKIPDSVRAEVKRRTHGRCHLCLWRLGQATGAIAAAVGGEVRHVDVRGVKRIAHLHHVFPKDTFPELIAEPWNLLGLCVDCHFGHEYPGVRPTRIPREALPAATIALAAGHGPRGVYLERAYPLTAGATASRHDEGNPNG